MFIKLPEFMAFNLKCDLHFCYVELCNDVHSASVNVTTKINVIDVSMRLIAKE